METMETMNEQVIEAVEDVVDTVRPSVITLGKKEYGLIGTAVGAVVTLTIEHAVVPGVKKLLAKRKLKKHSGRYAMDNTIDIPIPDDEEVEVEDDEE